MSETMKALLLRQHGGLENLELVTNHPKPAAKPGAVVIRVRASSFNYHDVFTVNGMPGIKVPLPVVIGLDMAGEITEVGNGVTGWKPGDRVFLIGFSRGAFAARSLSGLISRCGGADSDEAARV